TLADGVIAPSEQDRFIATVERLTSLKAGELTELTFTVDAKLLRSRTARGIFDWQNDAPVKRAATR
ncbi:MAG: MmgE/PrpD family protein, partial [Bosea sp. (in: a-proteobacteria)]